MPIMICSEYYDCFAARRLLTSPVVANAATCQTIAHHYNTGKGYHSHYMNRTQETVRDLMLAGF
jgi:hypothetical protein